MDALANAEFIFSPNFVVNPFLELPRKLWLQGMPLLPWLEMGDLLADMEAVLDSVDFDLMRQGGAMTYRHFPQ